MVTRVLAANPSLKPPKKWADEKLKEIKKGNPSYSEEQVHDTMGDIWYHKLDDAKRKEIRHREGKDYGPAKSATADLEGIDPKPYHLHLKVAIDEIGKALDQIRGHDPKNDEIRALEDCKGLLGEMLGMSPEAEITFEESNGF